MANSLIPQEHGALIDHAVVSQPTGLGNACKHIVFFFYATCLRTFDGNRWAVRDIFFEEAAALSDADLLAFMGI